MIKANLTSNGYATIPLDDAEDIGLSPGSRVIACRDHPGGPVYLKQDPIGHLAGRRAGKLGFSLKGIARLSGALSEEDDLGTYALQIDPKPRYGPDGQERYRMEIIEADSIEPTATTPMNGDTNTTERPDPFEASVYSSGTIRIGSADAEKLDLEGSEAVKFIASGEAVYMAPVIEEEGDVILRPDAGGVKITGGRILRKHFGIDSSEKRKAAIVTIDPNLREVDGLACYQIRAEVTGEGPGPGRDDEKTREKAQKDAAVEEKTPAETEKTPVPEEKTPPGGDGLPAASSITIEGYDEIQEVLAGLIRRVDSLDEHLEDLEEAHEAHKQDLQHRLEALAHNPPVDVSESVQPDTYTLTRKDLIRLGYLVDRIGREAGRPEIRELANHVMDELEEIAAGDLEAYLPYQL